MSKTKPLLQVVTKLKVDSEQINNIVSSISVDICNRMMVDLSFPAQFGVTGLVSRKIKPAPDSAGSPILNKASNLDENLHQRLEEAKAICQDHIKENLINLIQEAYEVGLKTDAK